jgi:peptidyl-prolyl cis-trans isomerase D
MLQTIRSKTHGVVAWIVIIVIGFVFAIWGIEGYFSSGANQVATVNGEVVTTQELQRTYQQLVRQQQMMQALQGGQGIDEALLQQHAISGLVSEKMLSTIAHQQGFAIGKEQVDDILRMLPQFQDNGTFSPEKFESVLNNMGYTPAEFRRAVKNDLMIGQVRSSIVDSAFVLPYEFDRTVDLLEQTRDIEYLLISAATYLPQVQVSDEQIRDFYNARPGDFMLPERMSLQYVRLNAEALPVENPTDAALQDYYNTHQAQYTEPEKRHAAHILLTREKINGDEQALDALAQKIMQELQQGADFSALAKQYSADPGSSEQGGDLGWFGRGVMVAEFEKPVFDAQTGALIGPIKTDFGLHIIKVIAVQPEVVKPFDSVKEEVKSAWVAQQRQTLFDQELAQLDTLAFENPEHLDAAAEALKLPIEKTEVFTRENTQTLGPLNTPAIIEAAFADVVLLENRNSELVYLTPMDVVVLRKQSYEEPQLQSIEAVQEKIKAHLASEQAAKLAHEQANTWLAELKSGVAPDKLKTELSWMKEAKTNRYNHAVPPDVLNKAFALPTSEAAVSSDIVPVGKEDYALIIVTAVYPGQLNPDFAEAMREEYMAGLTAFKGEMDYQLYVIDAEKHSDIEVKM